MVELHQNTVVFTSDEQKLGAAVRIYRNPREDDIDPERKVFESYLYVFNVDYPERFFIPLAYLERYDEKADRIILNVTMAQIEHDMLTRKPLFVALGNAVEESLAT